MHRTPSSRRRRSPPRRRGDRADALAGSRTRSSSGNDDLDRVALVGIHTRGVPLAQRLRRLIAERAGVERRRSASSTSPSTATTSTCAAARRRGTRSRSSARRRSTSRSRARPCVLVDDVLYTGRTIRAAIDALFDYGRPGARAARRARRPRPPRAADPPRLRRQEPADRARRAHPGAARRGRRGRPRPARPEPEEESPMADIRVMRDELLPPRQPPRRHLISIDDLDARRRRAAARDRAQLRALARARGEEAADAARPHGRQPLLRVLDAHARRASSSPRSASRADTMSIKAAGSSVDKGESLKDTALTLGAYDPDVIVIRHPQIGAPQLVARVHRRARRQRRRRQAPASDAGAARPLHDPATSSAGIEGLHVAIVGDVLHSRVARSLHPGARAVGAQRDARRPADADPARDRGAGLRGLARHRRDRATPTSSTSCACSASGWTRARTTCPRCASTRRAGASRPSGCARARR